MKTAVLGFVPVAILIITGCTPCSSNPLYSPDVAATDVDLSGVWLQRDKDFPDNLSRFVITKKPKDGGYSLREDGHSTASECYLVRLGSLHFLDVLIPSGSSEHNPTHIILLVRIKDNSIGLYQCDQEKLARLLQMHPIPNVTDFTGQHHFVAKTRDLQKFFADVGEDLFSFDLDHETLFRQDGRAILKSNKAD